MSDYTGRWLSLRKQPLPLMVGQSWETRVSVGPDGQPQVSVLGGPYAALGGGSSPFSTPQAFITAKVPSLVVPVFVDEMNAITPNWTFAQSGSNFFVGQNLPGGVCQIGSGATPTLATARNTGAVAGANGGDFIGNAKTDVYALYTRIKPGTNPGSSDVRMCNLADESNYNLGIGMIGGSPNWQLRVGAGNTDLGVAATAAWHDLLIISDGTNLFSYVDYTLLNTLLLSSLSGSFAHSGHINLLCGTSNCSFFVDRVLAVTAAAS
jgi:hypothetical protein